MNWKGETEVTAYATGLKMAIFDVSDYNNPKELHSIKIGGRGSYSELLYNHKSLLFDEEPSPVVASDEEPSPDCKSVFVYDFKTQKPSFFSMVSRPL